MGHFGLMDDNSDKPFQLQSSLWDQVRLTLDLVTDHLPPLRIPASFPSLSPLLIPRVPANKHPACQTLSQSQLPIESKHSTDI